MREKFLVILKEHFHDGLIHCSCRKQATQAQMAVLLAMDVRSFADLDHGKSGCSGLTLACFLLYCCDDPLAFLNNLRADFDGCDVSVG